MEEEGEEVQVQRRSSACHQYTPEDEDEEAEEEQRNQCRSSACSA